MANYTYLSRRNLSSSYLIPINTPRHKLYGALGCRPLQRLLLMADILYEAGRWSQNDAGSYVAASTYANAGLSAEVELGRGISVQGSVHNLLDRDYFLMEGYPEPGRTGLLSLRYRF